MLKKKPTVEPQSNHVLGADTYQQECTLLSDRNFNIEWETCIRYLAYYVMCPWHKEEQFVRVSVGRVSVSK